MDLAAIVDRLATLGAKVIGVDMLLDFKSAYGEDESDAFAEQECAACLRVKLRMVNIRAPTAIPRFDDVTVNGYEYFCKQRYF